LLSLAGYRRGDATESRSRAVGTHDQVGAARLPTTVGTDMSPDEPLVPARRRFLGRAAAALGALGVGAAGAPASAQTTPPTTRSRPPVGHHVPELREGSAHATAIQTAMDRAADQGGGVVVLPVAELVLDRTLRVESHVTLRGMGLSGTVLVAGDGMTDPLISVRAGAEGVALESLALDGRLRAAHGVRFEGSASYCVCRRVRIHASSEHGLVLVEGPYRHLAFEQVGFEAIGADAFHLSSASCTSVFLSEISVEEFGAEQPSSVGLRLGGRCHVSQVSIDPVAEGQVGILFAEGSDQSTLTNYYVRSQGGVAHDAAGSVEVAVGPGAVE
jgi:hypothetical protein